MKPGYFAIIPANVRYDNRLSAAEKLMFSEITALSGKDGYAFANNSYFAELYGVDERTIRRWISKLVELKYVSVSMAKKANGADDFRRIIPLVGPDINVQGGGQKCPLPPDKNVRPLYKEEQFKVNKRGGRFTPPTLQEVEAYCMSRHNSVNPQQFIDFYASKGWMVGKNKMKDWKAAIRTWENRDKKESNVDKGREVHYLP